MILATLSIVALSVCGGAPQSKALSVKPVGERIVYRDTCVQKVAAPKRVAAPRVAPVRARASVPARKPGLAQGRGLESRHAGAPIVQDCRDEWIKGFTLGAASVEAGGAKHAPRAGGIVSAPRQSFIRRHAVGIAIGAVVAGVAVALADDDDVRTVRVPCEDKDNGDHKR